MNEPETSAVGLITSVETQKRSKRRFNIFIDEAFAFSVHEDIMVKHRLLKGEYIDPKRTAEVLGDEERHEVYMRALRLIGRRPHARKELERKLKERGYEAELIDWACSRLQAEHYLDDEAFARQVTEQRIYSQRKGRNLVKEELRQKGVAKELVQEALGAVDPEEELAGALKIAETKWRQTGGSFMDRKRKTAAFLMRRGYTGNIVSKALAQIAVKTDTDEAGGEEDEVMFEDY
ncbi:RecX family transcriptional regulator [Paenibacillus athensensis]|uniref:Regulatory protein RecX n=1 Tax=Paenibacillus athensensis TaxID=1967502 RepID=A0A4Y8QAX0_9BACL|nr:RecX family transcriptional regulator [Paenibacillus athensensis]MCD1257743.1 RecX family transcriptional regulator [Paenibacillus athensensis]